VTHVKIALLEARKPFLGCSFSNRVFSVDGTNVSGGPCSVQASIELVKEKVSEMLIFLNLTLRSFSPEIFVPLAKIKKFQKGLIEENETYKMVHDIANKQFLLGRIRPRQKPHELMHQPNTCIFLYKQL
jgi:hypothetical protein